MGVKNADSPDLTSGPPDPDEGWVRSVEETVEAVHLPSTARECPACGDEFRPNVERHVTAIVRLRDVDRGVPVRLCSWECWQEWATR